MLNPYKYFRIAPTTALVLSLLVAVGAQAASIEEQLVEQLLDMEALVQTGLNYEEYSRQSTTMTLLFAKCKRARACNDQNLQASVAYLTAAKNVWAEKIENASEDSETMSAIRMKQLQNKWHLAFHLLSKYSAPTQANVPKRK